MWALRILLVLVMTGRCAVAKTVGENVVAKTAGSSGLVQPLLTINLALRDGKFYLGEVPARIRGEAAFAVSLEDFLKAAGPVLNDKAQDMVRKLPAETGFVRMQSLKEAGLAVEFDLGQMTLCVSPRVEQRPQGHIRLSQGDEITAPDRYAKQSALSGYVNLYGSAQYEGAAGGTRASLTRTLGTSSAVRVMNVVFENEATISNGAVTRQGSRMIYDDPVHSLRYTAGDVAPTLIGQQGGASFFGFSVEKSDARLQPQKNIRPTGERSFRLERPSEVDIYINGQLVRRLQMPPGDHDVSDLPLRAGENILRLEITDDTGQHTTLNFTVFFDHTLLAPGVEEWGVAAGLTSKPGLDGITYDWRNPAATAYYQLGLTENLTGMGHIQADSHALMAGFMGVAQSKVGYFSLEGAASVRWDGVPGVAATLAYAPGALLKDYGLPGLAQIALNFRSEDFTPILGSGGGQASINGFYSVPLAEDIALSVSGSATVESAIRLGGGVSITRTVTPDLAWGVTASYSNLPPVTGAPETSCWSILGRLTVKLDQNSQVSFTHDQGAGKSVAEVTTHARTAEGSYSIKAQVEDDSGAGMIPAGPQEQTDLSASYSGSRFDVAASTSRRLVQGWTTLSNVSVISGAGAIAFAGDQVAMGRPVSDSFAIITPHASLEDATIHVAPGPNGDRGVSGLFGNALVSDLSSYTPSQLPIQVDGAPDGYDLGSGLFELRPGYRSGYALQVGSDYSVTAIGILEDSGKPLALLSGLAKESAAANARKAVIFTNGEGRFAAEGLKPGPWRIEILSDPPLCFSLQIPDRTAGLFNAGTLKQRCSP